MSKGKDEDVPSGQKTKEDVSDHDLKRFIKARLRKDSHYYMTLLKNLIDEVKDDIPDEVFFDALRPRFVKNVSGPESYPKGEIDEKYRGEGKQISSKGVDMLFYPQARNRLKKWQKIYFANQVSEGDRRKAEAYIRKVFETLITVEPERQDVPLKERKAYQREGIRPKKFRTPRRKKS